MSVDQNGQVINKQPERILSREELTQEVNEIKRKINEIYILMANKEIEEALDLSKLSRRLKDTITKR